MENTIMQAELVVLILGCIWLVFLIFSKIGKIIIDHKLSKIIKEEIIQISDVIKGKIKDEDINVDVKIKDDAKEEQPTRYTEVKKYEEMNIQELKEIAKEKHIPKYYNMLKKDLVKALNEEE